MTNIVHIVTHYISCPRYCQCHHPCIGNYYNPKSCRRWKCQHSFHLWTWHGDQEGGSFLVHKQHRLWATKYSNWFPFHTYGGQLCLSYHSSRVIGFEQYSLPMCQFSYWRAGDGWSFNSPSDTMLVSSWDGVEGVTLCNVLADQALIVMNAWWVGLLNPHEWVSHCNTFVIRLKW